jgi:hypothetical protein
MRFIFTRSMTPENPSSGVAAEPLLDLPHHAKEIGAGAVHLVDKREPRHVILRRLPPDGFGLRLHTANRAEHSHRAIEHA